MPGPRLDRSQTGKLKRLLDMQYTVAELAAEIGLSPDAIYRSHIPAGVPVSLDDKRRVWINGAAFRDWFHQTLVGRGSRRRSMADGEAYCMRCNKIVQVQKSKTAPHRRGVRQLSGRCPLCNGKINRFLAAIAAGSAQ